MPKDNYKQEQSRYDMVGTRAVSRATGARLSEDESRGIKHIHNWARSKADGRRHNFSFHDCGIEKQKFEVICTLCSKDIQPMDDHVLAVEYDLSDDPETGRGRFKNMELICESCWERETGKRLSRQRFDRRGPRGKAAY